MVSGAALLTGLVAAGGAQAACRNATIEAARYVICEFDAHADIELFLQDQSGATIGEFDRVRDTLAARNRKLLFAMNAGMYHADRSPVGLYVEDGRKLKSLSTADGPGNFSLKPNGVFFIANGKAGVLETKAFQRKNIDPKFATQSGPMLVIDGKLHPRFLKHSPCPLYPSYAADDLLCGNPAARRVVPIKDYFCRILLGGLSKKAWVLPYRY